jgi:hypothetical protein
MQQRQRQRRCAFKERKPETASLPLRDTCWDCVSKRSHAVRVQSAPRILTEASVRRADGEARLSEVWATGMGNKGTGADHSGSINSTQGGATPPQCSATDEGVFGGTRGMSTGRADTRLAAGLQLTAHRRLHRQNHPDGGTVRAVRIASTPRMRRSVASRRDVQYRVVSGTTLPLQCRSRLHNRHQELEPS